MSGVVRRATVKVTDVKLSLAVSLQLHFMTLSRRRNGNKIPVKEQGSSGLFFLWSGEIGRDYLIISASVHNLICAHLLCISSPRKAAWTKFKFIRT